jgi:hypothetical protein
MTEICYNPATEIVYVTIHGEFNARDLVSIRQKVRESPLFGNRALIDLTDRIGVFSNGEIDYMVRSGEAFGDIALIARPQSATYGLCRMFQVYANGPRKIGGFTDPVEAETWLIGSPPRQISVS